MRLAVPTVGVMVVVFAVRFTFFRPPVISVAAIERGNVIDEVEGTGTVTADVLSNVASKITGRVEQVHVDEGDVVKKGQILATLDQTDLRRQVDRARAQLASARESAQEAQWEANRRQILIEQGQLAATIEEAQQFSKNSAVAQHSVEAAEADLSLTKYNLSLTQIPSLSSGIVIKRWVNVGDSVVPGEQMFTVAATSLIYVNASIDQNFTGKIKKNEKAAVILRGRERHPLTGYVLRISPQADAATEEMVAEVAFTISPDEFQLGQWANVFIKDGEAENALVVPRAALMSMNNKTFVFVVGADNKLHREQVTVLAESPRRPMVAVSGNLKPHEHVVLMPMGLTPGETVRPKALAKAQALEAQP